MPCTDDTLTCPNCAAEEPGAVPIAAAAGNLDGWTREELFAEAVKRSGGDPPALRLMQGVVLAALLTAHDRRRAAGHRAS